ncbi:MAG: DNA gyrase subunit A, partial [Acidiferrobacterales bacterium]
VEFSPNYDGTEHIPDVMPTKLPNLLVNGSSGIAVGMATNIPPHNLNEVLDACLALLENEDLGIDEIMKIIPGPDFPTAGIINGVAGIREAYRTGRGRIYVRARLDVETDEKSKRQRIIVHELPYQVNKARLLERIAELVKDAKLDGISGLRDESDKSGMRMVIELKRGEVAEVVINNLYKHTAMQNVFGINMVALDHGQPRLFNLKQMLEAFLRHRREVITRRTIYDMRKSRERAHLLEGLAVALENIDRIIVLIKAAKDPAAAKVALMAEMWPAKEVANLLARSDTSMSRPEDLDAIYGLSKKGYKLSNAQAQAILELRLHRLTGLEQEKIHSEYNEILERIEDLMDILQHPERLRQEIELEIKALRERYGDERRTEIIESQQDLSMEDLIAEEDVVVTLSHAGYIKSQSLSEYRAQKRGGRGKTATRMREEDFVDKLFIANTHDTILCFSSRGKVYWLKVYSIPQAGRGARGKPIVNLLPLEEGEQVNAILPIRGYEEGKFVFMATSDGTVKKTSLIEFSRPRTSGIIAIDLANGNQLVGVGLTDGNSDLLLFSTAGKVVRFKESDVRAMGRNARGVKGMALKKDQKVISQIIASSETSDSSTVLTATSGGFGKRTVLTDFPRHKRGGQGVISIQVTGKRGEVVGALLTNPDSEMMLITSGGTLIRTRTDEISMQGRNTQGVTLIGLSKGERLVGMDEVMESEDVDS